MYIHVYIYIYIHLFMFIYIHIHICTHTRTLQDQIATDHEHAGGGDGDARVAPALGGRVPLLARLPRQHWPVLSPRPRLPTAKTSSKVSRTQKVVRTVCFVHLSLFGPTKFVSPSSLERKR